MREILFRGKRLDNGKYVDGNLFVSDTEGRTYILVGSRIVTIEWEIDPSTIGQYTGLTDKNGKRIFEGDIVRTHYANTRKADFVEQVVFHNGRFSSLYELRGPGNGKMWANLPDSVPHLPMDKTPYMEWCEIIGNIHDNPELLDGSSGK